MRVEGSNVRMRGKVNNRSLTMKNRTKAGQAYIDGGADEARGRDFPCGLGGALGFRKFDWAKVATKVCVRSNLSKMLRNVEKRRRAVRLSFFVLSSVVEIGALLSSVVERERESSSPPSQEL